MKRTALLGIFVAVAVCGVFAADTVTRGDAARLRDKIARISQPTSSLGPRAAARTPISEVELNSYLRFEMGNQMPAGVQDPWVTLLEGGRVAGRATVDLARVAESRKPSGTLDPFSYMAGSMPLTVNGLLRTQNGIGTFSLESASVSGVPVPAWMIQEIVSHYSKSTTTPQGVSIDKPFVLPSGIREIQLTQGQAIVIQ